MRRLWTVKELADYLAVKPSTIYLWVRKRSIPHLVLSRGPRKSCLRFRPEEVESWLNRRQRKGH
jgi:excisionase family DNA binding protein